jgi:hypothetical protein
VGTAIPGCYASARLRATSMSRLERLPVRLEDLERAIGELDPVR